MIIDFFFLSAAQKCSVSFIRQKFTLDKNLSKHPFSSTCGKDMGIYFCISLRKEDQVIY